MAGSRCGFTSPSHFSKCYRAHYKRTPYRERGVSGPGPAKGEETGEVGEIDFEE